MHTVRVNPIGDIGNAGTGRPVLEASAASKYEPRSRAGGTLPRRRLPGSVGAD
ncbi:hypothetical protein GCM10010306_086940 [Streptomyces umbrinus]|nr:hypothetical protein GCM10010306_086940 [Streptomyces umbrinus]